MNTNTTSKIYAIGDIHGSFVALKTLFQKINIHQDDVFVFMGDYIDRGIHSKQVVDFVMHCQETLDVITLKVNHEILCCESASGNKSHQSIWLQHGGIETLQSYGCDKQVKWNAFIPQSHWNFFNGLLNYYETEDYIFVHAGLDRAKSLNEQTPESLFWQRFDTQNSSHRPHISGKTVVMGHTPMIDGRVHHYGHSILVDTYSYGDNGWLSCYDLINDIAYQADNQGNFRCNEAIKMTINHDN